MKQPYSKTNKQGWNQDDFLDTEDVVSGTECTGLIPSAPLTESESESYAELYTIPTPKQEEQQQRRSRSSKK